jgi:hypothetical protein
LARQITNSVHEKIQPLVYISRADKVFGGRNKTRWGKDKIEKTSNAAAPPPLSKTSHGEQNSDDAQKSLAAAACRQFPVKRHIFRLRTNKEHIEGKSVICRTGTVT